MKQKLYYLLGLVTLLSVSFSIPAYAATGLVNTDSVNVRQEATTSSEVIETLAENTRVEVVKEETDGWYQIRYNDKDGYIKGEFLTIEEEKNETKTPDAVQTNTENAKNVKILKTTKLRITPVINANILSELAEGTEVEIVTKTNNWAFVQNDKVIGWIPRSSIENKTQNTKVEEKKEETKPEETKPEEVKTENIYENSVTKYVFYDSVNMREQPTTDSESITSVDLNTEINVIGEDGEWYKVEYNGDIGYIRKDLLSDTKNEVTSRSNSFERTQMYDTEAASGTGADVVNYAMQYLGCPYEYGAAGSDTFDCSGFTMYVYDHFGIDIPHGATSQSYYGISVSYDDLQPGDLVYFRDYETNEGIGHVGIYIGGGEFIHASSGSGYCVKISDLTYGSYEDRYMCATRLIY